jgi:antitoxin (DNA-binding transcriptional repressor) of toxin-antitoxin stability system
MVKVKVDEDLPQSAKLSIKNAGRNPDNGRLVDMKTRNVTIQEVEQHPRDFFDEAGKGEEIIVNDDGEPIARIVPPLHRVPGLHQGKVQTSDDFDAPLESEFWLGDAK